MEALGQLTGGVAHDFNNLLMVVSGQAQTLMRRLSNPKNMRALEAILAAAARGEALTRHLLTFSRRQPQNPQTVCPNRTIAAFRDVLASAVRGEFKLLFDIQPTIWPVSIDVAEFELALVNLVVNARDAMPEGGTISVTGENVQLAGSETVEGLRGEFVALTVKDTGTGIAPDILSKIFEPFFTTKGPNKGTGLGLSQAYGFARQSNGAITVKSEIGQGTDATIYLPRSRGVLSAANANEPRINAFGRGEMILVVEDNAEVKKVAVELLEMLNYRTIAVENAKAALDALANGPPVDLVFTDVMLAGEMDGLALAQSVRSLHPDVPVLLTSGYAKVLLSQRGWPILRKPYQISALGEAVRAALEARASSNTAAALC
jgi:CheY-like chemotaxis protein